MLTTSLSAYEVELLTSLVTQLVELVSDGEPAGFGDPSGSRRGPFEALVADLQVDPDEPESLGGPGAEAAVPQRVPARPGGLIGLPPVHRAG